MFLECDGEHYKVVYQDSKFFWVVSLSQFGPPKQINRCEAEKDVYDLPEDTAPDEFISSKKIKTRDERYDAIRPLIESTRAIYDNKYRKQTARLCADHSKTSLRTILCWYYRVLAGGKNALLSKDRERPEKAECSEEQKTMKRFINKYVLSSYRMPLREAYDLMLSQSYVGQDGSLMEARPSFNQFRYLYSKISNPMRRVISQEGITNYQKNVRPLYGNSMTRCGVEPAIGSFQMDATTADIYLVSRFNKKRIVDRPIVYLAVDSVSQLICGFSVGYKAGYDAFARCMINCAEDKTEYCKKYGVSIEPDDWPCKVLPGEIITDKGRDFISGDVRNACEKYNIRISELPAFRPDLKGAVEKAFDLIQSKYKPYLRYKGIVEKDENLQGAREYRLDASLTIEQYTEILIRTIVFLNGKRVLQNFVRSAEMEKDGMRPTPSGIWKWFAEKRKQRIIEPGPNLYINFLPRDTAHFTQKGLLYKGLYYMNHKYDMRAKMECRLQPQTVTHYAMKAMTNLLSMHTAYSRTIFSPAMNTIQRNLRAQTANWRCLSR